MSDKTRDSLNRRFRFADPQPTGVKVYPGETGLEIFQYLDDHGPLSTEWLASLAKDVITNPQFLVKRMCTFYNEDNAPCGGQYVYKPWQQQNTGTWKKQPLVYANTLRAWRYLESKERLEPRLANYWREIEDFWHEYMISCITASIRLACREAGLKFITRRDIIGNRPLSVSVPITFEGEKYNKPLRPDELFAIEWPSGGRRYFFLEADRDTEGVESKSLKNASYRRKLLQYKELIQGGLYKDLLGIEKGAVLCLHVTTSESHMHTIINALTKITEGKGNNYNLFKSAPQFGRYPYIDKPTLDFGMTDWIRSVREPMNILAA